ncbi:hypothetical protein [Mycobacterium sp. GA-2829]|nr:hypothetical protein [Mycobacterium sp. GA-2829]
MRFRARGGGLWWQLVALVAVIVIMGAFSVEAARLIRLGTDEVDCSKPR